MEGFNNYTGHMSYISTWEERQRKMQQNKADVKRDRFDLFNDLGIESKEVIDGIGDCSKCFYKYDCHKKQNGYYCRHYLDCSEHDSKVWDSAIDECKYNAELFREIFLEELINQSVDREEAIMYRNICEMSWSKYLEQIKEQKNELV